MSKLLRFSVKSPVLVIAFLLVILASGCELISQDTGFEIPEVFSGTEGIEAIIAPGSIPPVISDVSDADVVLLIANKGALDVNSKDITITIKDTKNAFHVGTKNTIELPVQKFEGKERNIVGSLESTEVKITAKGLLEGEEEKETKFLVTACYSYKTELTAAVCVDASPLSFQKERKPCDENKPLILSSQGAPVAVRKIETTTIKSATLAKPTFKIYVGNVGDGKILNKNNLELFCTSEGSANKDEIPEINVVVVDSVMFRGKPLVCGDDIKETSEKEILLTGNSAKDYIDCEYTGNDITQSMGTFVSPLEISLSYGYRSITETSPVRIRKSQLTVPEDLEHQFDQDQLQNQ
jgi:hypothetical protein